jgi:hypothetical protein
MRYSTTRLWIWLPPALFFSLSTIVAIAAPSPRTRAFYILLSSATGYWLIRALRVGVEISTDGVAVHGQVRTRRYRLTDVRRARAEPMRTSSPLYRVVRYVALELEFTDDESRHFDEISVRERDRSVVDRIVDSINAAASPLST